MASLRSRLIAALLALTAVGLLLLGGITYFGQRSYLLDRLDEDLRGAQGAAVGALEERGVEDVERGRRGPGPRGGPPPGEGLPLGTYVERRDASGKVLGSRDLDFNDETSADPALPADLPLERPFTVSGENGDDTRYRVYAVPDPHGVTVVAAPMTDIDDALQRLLLLEALVIVVVLLVLGAVAWAVVRVGLLPLDRMGHTAGAIAGGDLSRRVESTDPRTEVGRLGIALNAMLDRLERAFAERQASEDRLRRFLADASHELRTPLASIRGYAELYRTRLDEIAEAPHTEVPLDALAGDAVDDARATAPDREIAVVGDGESVVMGDAHQLRQVLGNLLRNALVHTPAGSPIDVSVARDGGAVRVEVRDHGPGLPSEDPSALFDRFWRAEGGRERGKAGAGLGLAIVAAIVDAHGGSVSAANAEGGGAVFAVVLPATSTTAG
jgi:two-component system, OmpR family, sensor kinase